jgi:peptidoglycan/LPS O-acetylase OafA/YrhL
LGDYFTKRAKRLLPAYVFVILVCAIGLAFISTFTIDAYFHHASFYKYLLANVTFLNFLHPCLPGVFEKNMMCAINGSLWTIKVEVAFYLIVPILCHFISRSNKKMVLLTALYIAGLLYNYALFKVFSHMPGHDGLYFTLTHQLPSLMTYFIAGMALHYFFDDVLKAKNKLILIALPVFIIEYYWGYQVIRPVALAIIIFYAAYSFKFFNNFGKHGDISYGIYIYHFPVIQLFIYFGVFNFFAPVVAVLILITAVITLAILSWHLLEKRFLKKRIAMEKQAAG